MKKNNYCLLSVLGVLLATAGWPAFSAHASVTPTLSLNNASNGSMVQLNVYGDPGASVVLYYTNPAPSLLSTTLGTTDLNGNFSTPLSTNGGYGFGCGQTAYVVIDGIQSATVPWISSANSCQGLVLNQTNLSLAIGQSTVVTTSIAGSLSVTGNTNPSVANVSINGSQVTVTASNYGTTNLTVCSTSDTSQCATIYVAVNITGTTINTASPLSFSQSNVVLDVGQSQAVTISGSGSYYLSNNSSPTIVSANLNGNTLNLAGSSFGGSNITVCQTGGQCGNISVVVINNDSAVNTSNQAPALASFSISSNNATGKFMTAGDTLTFNFTTTEPVSNVAMSIGAVHSNVSGSGSGTYTASYSISGSESLPIPIVLTFNDAAGNSGRTALALGDLAVAIPAVSTPIAVSAPSTEYAFSSFLIIGDHGVAVTELQDRLTNLGFYTGPVNGNFGPLTQAAVRSLQKENGIAQAGYVGPTTRAVLNKY